MASHKATPATVLNAPMLRREVVSSQSDFNRAERRRAFRALDPETGKPVVLYRRKGTIPRVAQLPTRNRPYRKADPAAPVRATVGGRVGSAVGRVRSIVAGRREGR